jgi:hypothetical protein
MAEEERAWKEHHNNGKHWWKRKEQRLSEHGVAEDVLMVFAV